MPIDLLHPRKPTSEPTLWKRFGFWGMIAASLLALGGYLLWEKAADQHENGIDLAEGTWDDLTITAEGLGLEMPSVN